MDGDYTTPCTGNGGTDRVKDPQSKGKTGYTPGLLCRLGENLPTHFKKNQKSKKMKKSIICGAQSTLFVLVGIVFLLLSVSLSLWCVVPAIGCMYLAGRKSDQAQSYRELEIELENELFEHSNY